MLAPAQTRKRRYGRNLVFALALAALSGLAVWGSITGLEHGPLADWGGTTGAMPADVGERLSIGIVSDVNRGPGEIRLLSLTPDALPAGLRILGFRSTPFGHGCLGAGRSFPADASRYTYEPLVGAVVSQGQAACVVIGLLPTTTGLFHIPGFKLTYEVNGSFFSEHTGPEQWICVPSARYSLADCPPSTT